MPKQEETQAALPGHIASDFYLWLWYRSETGQGRVAPEMPADSQEDPQLIEFWVQDRIAFRVVGENKVSAVVTGDHPSGAPEARAALAGGKVLRDLRLAFRREDREYSVLLKGAGVEVGAAKIPGLVKTGDPAEILYERMFLYEELHWVIQALFRAYSAERTSDAWEERILPNMRRWAAGEEAALEA